MLALWGMPDGLPGGSNKDRLPFRDDLMKDPQFREARKADKPDFKSFRIAVGWNVKGNFRIHWK
jgi:hypothetical protein